MSLLKHPSQSLSTVLRLAPPLVTVVRYRIVALTPIAQPIYFVVFASRRQDDPQKPAVGGQGFWHIRALAFARPWNTVGWNNNYGIKKSCVEAAQLPSVPDARPGRSD